MRIFNNSKRRRVEKEAKKVPGKKVAYNEDRLNRREFRALAQQWMNCDFCGDKMQRKDYNAHLAKAMRHHATKAE